MSDELTPGDDRFSVPPAARASDALPAPGPKQRLLAALIEHLAEQGLGDTSLRGMAKAVGSSHRMLAYHFGSREALLTEVSKAVERRQRADFEAMLADPGLSPLEVMARMYAALTDPALRPQERLFFELYGRALVDPEESSFLPEVVVAWLPPLTELFLRMGLAPDEAAAEARLSLAVSRGVLLDLLATGDGEAAHAVFERYTTRFTGA